MQGSTDPVALEGFGLPYWLDLPRPRYGTLDRPVTADVAIIGSGIAGLKLAHRLAQRGLTAVICEATQVGSGASGRNQGSIVHNPGMGYEDCIRSHSRAIARDFWRMGLENHRMIREQISEYAIECDYLQAGMTTMIRTDLPGWEARIASARAESTLLREDGFDVDWLDEKAATDAGNGARGIYAGALRYNTNAQFHSGKYVVGLARGISRLPGVKIFEGVRVRGIARSGNSVRLETSSHPVEASAVFLETNAWAPQLVPSLERALRAERGQVRVTAPLSDRPCCGSFGTMLAWWREVTLPDGRFRLLFGGGRDRDEPDSLLPQFRADGSPHPQLEKAGFAPSVAHQQRLDTQFDLLFPQYRGVAVTHRWGGLQSFTADYFPVIGCLDEERKLYGAVGFCGGGNTYSDVAAEYLAGKIAGVRTPTEERFGHLFERQLRPFRPSANWGEWKSAFAR
jgi:glycine/D-amino acid oxidase-like deaminating enzyme